MERMRMIQLTSARAGEAHVKIYIVKSKIEYMTQQEKHTQIHLDSGKFLEVKETVNQIKLKKDTK